MMSTIPVLIAGLFSLAALVLAAHYLLKGWQGWLEVRKLEVARGGPSHDEGAPVMSGGRIELADLKERVRKLEAIASGIDL